MTPALPITIQALVAAIIIGIGTRLLVAVLAKGDAPDWLTGTLSGLITAGGVAIAYLIDVKGVPDWQHVLGLFLTSLAAGGAFKVQTGVPLEGAVKAATSKFGLGGGNGATPTAPPVQQIEPPMTTTVPEWTATDAPPAADALPTTMPDKPTVEGPSDQPFGPTS